MGAKISEPTSFWCPLLLLDQRQQTAGIDERSTATCCGTERTLGAARMNPGDNDKPAAEEDKNKTFQSPFEEIADVPSKWTTLIISSFSWRIQTANRSKIRRRLCYFASARG